jgi:formylglycine-generating enzyme required for sulfatase activity
VGEKAPNAWGLYDMHGNVWEWMEDDYHGSYEGALDGGRAWIDKPRGSVRVFRGGSWSDDGRYCRSAMRYNGVPGYRKFRVGFRLSRSVPLGP